MYWGLRAFDGMTYWCTLSHHHDYIVVIVTRHTVVYIVDLYNVDKKSLLSSLPPLAYKQPTQQPSLKVRCRVHMWWYRTEPCAPALWVPCGTQSSTLAGNKQL
jgi:hypothetical protein